MKRCLLLAASVAVILLASPSGAWVSLDDDSVWPHTTWSSLPVSYYLNQNGSVDLGGFTATETIVLDSFATWSGPICTLWDSYYQGTTTRMPTHDGRQVIGWIESGWPFDSSAIGVCSVYFSSGTEIDEADISMNGEDFHWNTSGSGGVDAQSICTHEMGHFVGLGDLYGSDCDLGQTMCGTYGGGRTKRTLTSDDTDGVCTLYPTGCSVPTDCPPGFDCVGGACVPVPSDVCAPCTYDAECGDTDDFCLYGFPDGGSYCGAGCLTSLDCDWGYVCITLTSGSRQCIPYDFSCSPPPAPECEFDTDCPVRFQCIDMLCVGGLCAPCTTEYECGGPDDYCVEGFPDGNDYCGTRCIISSDCPWGYQCVGIGSGISQCIPIDSNCADPPEPECTTELDCPDGFYCELGYCIEEPECTTSTDCPEGEICVDDECVPDPRPHLPVCAECSRHSDCGYGGDDLCLSGFVDGTTRCGQNCATVDDCGPGLMCYEFTGLPSQCIPTTMDCTLYCIEDTDCETGFHCEDGVCMDTCDPSDPLSCPDGFYCDYASCLTGHCVELPSVGAGALSAPCTTDLDCEGLRCETMLEGSACSRYCDFDAATCPSPMACQPAGDGTCGYCSCSKGLLGDACTANEDCQLNICVWGFCTMICPAECPPGFGCEHIADYDLCMPAAYGIGQTCDNPDECVSGFCTEYEGASFCSRPCDTSCTCPAGYECVDGRCVTHMEGSGDEPSGCGCSVVGSPGGVSLAFLLVALALLVRRRS